MKPARRLEDRVAVAHPAAAAPRAGPPSRRPPPSRRVSSVRPNSPASAALDPAAERLDHRLHPVTDAQHRDLEIEQLGREAPAPPARRPRPGPPESTSAFGAALADLLDRRVARQQLGEDPAFADPPRDQLRVLAPEVEDQDLLGGLGRRGSRLRRLRLGAWTIRSDVDPRVRRRPDGAAASVIRDGDPGGDRGAPVRAHADRLLVLELLALAHQRRRDHHLGPLEGADVLVAAWSPSRFSAPPSG